MAGLKLAQLPAHYSLLRVLKCVQHDEQLLLRAYENAVEVLRQKPKTGKPKAAKLGLAQAGWAPALEAQPLEPAEDTYDSGADEEPVQDAAAEIHDGYMQQQTNLQHEFDTLQSKYDTLSTQSSALQQQIATLKASESQLSTTVTDLQDDLANATQQLKDLMTAAKAATTLLGGNSGSDSNAVAQALDTAAKGAHTKRAALRTGKYVVRSVTASV
jgi:septal ring factor EnvC (AmiA/AmiB activator)